MQMTPEQLEQSMRRFTEVLKDAGVKLTQQRLEIFREISATDQHPDAETVYRGVRQRVPSVSLDTVYRTLWLLTDLGLITTLGQPRERMRFDANTVAHHHFICTACGSAHDFYCSEFDRLAAPAEVLGFGAIQRAQVEFIGLCADCERRQEAAAQDTTVTSGSNVNGR
jgi:Fur family peroxide stress response transcriptional regulator